MVVSFSGTGLCHIVLGTYIYMNAETNIDLSAYQWVPVTSFSAMIFVASCGANPIPYVVISEILPENVSIFMISFAVFVWRNFLSNTIYMLQKYSLLFRRFVVLPIRFACVFHGSSHLCWFKFFRI